MEKNAREKAAKLVLQGIVFVELVLLALFVFFLLMPYIKDVNAVVGANSVTVVTNLQVGNVFPDITNVTFFSSPVTLVPNSTSNAVVVAVIRDYNGEADIKNVTLTLFNTGTSSFGAADDNNRHYYNFSCVINTSYGSIYEANATCIIPLQYYAEPGTWNATIIAYTNETLGAMNSTTGTVNSLLALGLPNNINYGLVNAAEVSQEQIANVTNFGNVMMNLSLKGYANTVGDNLSMNCSLGYNKNISINYEKYNVSISNAGWLNLTQFEGAGANYTNLTSATTVIRAINLPYRQNDAAPFTDDTNSTYWRMYVPLGVAGTCQGNIVFGAVQAAGI